MALGQPHGCSPVTADLVRQTYDAIGRGNVEAFVGLLDPDVAWTVPGRHHLAGTFTGVPALLTHLAEVAQRTQGKIGIEVVEVIAGDDRAVAIVDVELSVDGRTVQDRQVHLFELRDGRITSVREYHGDEAAMQDVLEGPA
jgi:ketosteroid isomerase-like protein